MTSAPSSNFNGLTLLLADDEEINCLLTKAILAQSGFEVTVVGNGTEALAAARASQYDIIILDIQMPVMDGFAACTLLREIDTAQATPIIAMTAHVGTSFRQQCLAHGFTDYISKPFNGKEMLAKIAGYLASTSGA